MNKLILTIAALCLAAAPAITFAKTETITANVHITSSHSTFHKKDSANSQYEAVAQEQSSNVRIEGSGWLSLANQKKSSSDNKVIGIDYKGHNYVSLTQGQNGQTFLVIDTLMNDDIEGVHFQFSDKNSVPVEFTSGNWADYQAGKSVELRVMEAGVKMMVESRTSRFRASINNVRAAFQKQLADTGATFGEIRVTQQRSSDPVIVRGDLNRLEITSSNIEVTVEFDIDSDF